MFLTKKEEKYMQEILVEYEPNTDYEITMNDHKYLLNFNDEGISSLYMVDNPFKMKLKVNFSNEISDNGDEFIESMKLAYLSRATK